MPISHYWSGPILRSTSTGSRRYACEHLTHRQLPLPLLQSERDHKNTRIVGAITDMIIDTDGVWAAGYFFDDAPARRAAELVAAGVVGPSIELDENEVTMHLVAAGTDTPIDGEPSFPPPPGTEIVVTSGRIGSAVLVPVPAIAETANATILANTPQQATPLRVSAAGIEDCLCGLTASVTATGWRNLALIPPGTGWDNTAARAHLKTWATKADGTVDAGKYGRGFLWRDDAANPDTLGAYGFPICDIKDGDLVIVGDAIFAAAAAIDKSNATTRDKAGLRRVIGGLYTRMGRTPPWATASAGMTAAGGGVRLASPLRPPAAWFDNPHLDTPARPTITDEGRFYAHLGVDGVCHTNFPGSCETIPHASDGYSLFYCGGGVLTAEGTVVPAGLLVFDSPHADPAWGLQGVFDYHADTSVQIAYVQAHRDAHGVVLAGAVVPEATPEQVARLRRSKVSGHWQGSPGHEQLALVLACNNPGLPVYADVVADGERVGFVASYGFRGDKGTAPAGEQPPPLPASNNDVVRDLIRKKAHHMINTRAKAALTRANALITEGQTTHGM